MVAPQPTLTSLSGGGGQIVTTATKVVLKPLEDRIVVRPLEAEQTTASGLVIPDTAKEKPQEGEVLAVGTGVGLTGVCWVDTVRNWHSLV
jgi:hypothetical protein